MLKRLSYGQEESSSASDDVFKFTVNKRGYLKVEMDGPGTTCDWDFWVNSPSSCENIDRDSSNIAYTSVITQCDDSATSSFPTLTGIKNIKVKRKSGDGIGSINVKLLECVADDAVDSACPSTKPYCTS